MSKAKFDKAVAIIGGLPKNGPIKPSQDDQLYVSFGYALWPWAILNDPFLSSTNTSNKVSPRDCQVERSDMTDRFSQLGRQHNAPAWYAWLYWKGEMVSLINRSSLSPHDADPISRDAWTEVKGTTKEDAYTKYVEKLLEVSDT